MSLSKARELREQRAKLVADAQALIPATGAITPEARTKFDGFMTEADTLKGDIDRLERAEALAAEIRNAPPAAQIEHEQKADYAANVVEFRNAERRHGRKALDHVKPETRAAIESLNVEYWDAMKQYLVAGDANLAPEARALLNGKRAEFRNLGVGSILEMKEYRDLGSGGGNALQGVGGGYFVPVGFVNEIEEAMKWYGDMLRACRTFRTATGNPLPWPTDNDTTNTGELVGEGQQVSQGDVVPGSVLFGAYKFSTKMIKVSIELLQDSAFDLESYVKERMAVRLGRTLNTYFTTGTGVAQPKGIVIASTLGATAAGSATNDGSAADGTNSIGSDDLTDLEHSVDKSYRRGAAFMANDLTIKALKKVKDKYGRPLWLPGLAVAAPDTILEYPYFTNNDMDTIAASKKTVLFGQMEKYVNRAVKELAIVRLSERFADFGQVAFIGFARHDGNLVDAGTNPVKYLQQHA